MNIVTTINGTETELAFEGRLDTATSPQLEAELAALKAEREGREGRVP